MASEYKLHEHYSSNHVKCDSDGMIKPEDFVLQTVDSLDSKPGIHLISNGNAVEDILENIKIENVKQQLKNEISNTESCELELKEVETIKGEKCVINENIAILLEDPLSKDTQIDKQLKLDENFCKECNETFASEHYFKIHMSVHRRNTPFRCDSCDKRFAQPYLLKLHKIAHSESRPYSCSICGKCFKRSRDFTRHTFVHSDAKPFPCDQCDKSFQYNYRLRVHKVSHSDENVVSCGQCGESLESKRKLYNHIRSVHLVKKIHICSYCGKTFSRRNVMREHIKRHTGEKPYRRKIF